MANVTIGYCKDCLYLYHRKQEITLERWIEEHYQCRKSAPEGEYPHFPVIEDIKNEFCGAFRCKEIGEG